MTQSDPVDDVLRILGRIARLGPVEATAEHERERGRVVVRPGEADWLAPGDWEENTICSLAGREARLVLLVARNPGSGSVGRLLTAVDAAGLDPIVCAPSHRLADHLARRGWTSSRRGEGFTSEEEWRPPVRADLLAGIASCPDDQEAEGAGPPRAGPAELGGPQLPQPLPRRRGGGRAQGMAWHGR